MVTKAKIVEKFPLKAQRVKECHRLGLTDCDKLLTKDLADKIQKEYKRLGLKEIPTSSTKSSTKKSSGSKKASPKSSGSKKASPKSGAKKSSKTKSDCDISNSQCMKNTRAMLIALAKKCGVDHSGTKKDICNRIVNATGSAKTSPPKPSAKPSTKPRTKPSTKPSSGPCYKNYSKSKLNSMKVGQLDEYLDEIGIVNNRPKNKKERVEYLCAEECDPEVGCEDGNYCDVSNDIPVCLSSNSNKLGELVLPNGRTVIGTPSTLEILRQKLGGAPAEKSSPAKPSPAKPSPAKPSPAKPSPAKPSPAKPSPAKPSPAKPSPSASKDYTKQKVADLLALLRAEPDYISDNVAKKLLKKGLIAYLKAAQNGRCDSKAGVGCADNRWCNTGSNYCFDQGDAEDLIEWSNTASAAKKKYPPMEYMLRNGSDYFGTRDELDSMGGSDSDGDFDKLDKISTEVLDNLNKSITPHEDVMTKKKICITRKIAAFYENLYIGEDANDITSEYFEHIKNLYVDLLPLLNMSEPITENDLPTDGELSKYHGGEYGNEMNREILWKEIVTPCLVKPPAAEKYHTPKPTPPKPDGGDVGDGAEIKDMEGILSDLKSGRPVDVDRLTDVQRFCLNCLGLIKL